MNQMHVQLFSSKEKNLLNKYKTKYGVNVDGSRADYELAVVEAILNRMVEKNEIIEFRAKLFGCFENIEHIFTNLNIINKLAQDEQISDFMLKNQIKMEKHIIIIVMKANFCKAIYENYIHTIALKLRDDPEIQKTLINPGAKEEHRKVEAKMSEVVNEAHKAGKVVAVEINDVFNDINWQLNEVVNFFTVITVMHLSRLDSLKNNIDKLTLFVKDLLSQYVNDLYAKSSICHEIAILNHEIKKRSPMREALNKYWIKNNNELAQAKAMLLIKKKELKSKKELFAKVLKNHNINDLKDFEAGYLEEMVDLFMFVIGVKSIELINKRIFLENLQGNYYFNIMNKVFADTKNQDDELLKEVATVTKKIKDLKNRKKINPEETAAAYSETLHLSLKVLKEIDSKISSLKLMKVSTKSELQEQQLLMALYKSMRWEHLSNLEIALGQDVSIKH